MNANNSAIDTNTATGTTGTTTTTPPYRPSTTGESILSGSYPRHSFAERGWICPVCGRGCSPNTAYCNCNSYRDITYLNGGLALGSTISGAIHCTDNACTEKTTAQARTHGEIFYS